MSIVRNIAKQEAAFEHADWVERDGEMVERYRQAAAAERADTFQIPEFPDMTEYMNPVCRGSFALGSACKICEKCLEELERMRGFGAAVGEVQPTDPSGDTTFLKPKISAKTDPGILWTDDEPKPETYTQTLPVAGYKNEQPAWVIELVNINKVLEEACLRQLDHIKVKYSAEVDQRQLALSRTAIENAFYHSNRALYQPQRILSGPSSDKAAAILKAVGSRAGLSAEELEQLSS